MADIHRLVRTRWPLPPQIVLDLNDANRRYWPTKDSFNITPAEKSSFSTRGRSRRAGSRKVWETLGNARVGVELAVVGTDASDALLRTSALLSLAEETNPGLAYEWRPDGAPRSTYYEIAGPASWTPTYSWGPFAGANALRVAVQWECAPLALAPTMDYAEAFDDPAVISRYLGIGTGTAITSANGTISGDRLSPAGASTPGRIYLGEHFDLDDAEVTAHLVLSATWTGTQQFAVAGRIRGTGGSTTWIMFLLDVATGGPGANITGTLYSVTANGGGTASLGASGTVATRAGMDLWVRLILVGNDVRGEIHTSEPTPMRTPEASATGLLTDAQRAIHGPGAWSPSGWLWANPGWVAGIADWTLRPFTYRAAVTPEDLEVGFVPGDAPARLNVEVTPSGNASGSGANRARDGGSFPVYGLVGWAARAGLANHLVNGDAEGNDVLGWNTGALASWSAAPSGVTVQSSVAGTAAAKHGTYSVQIVSGATADVGRTWRFLERAKRGRYYIGWGWAWAATPTNQLRLALGVVGDVSTPVSRTLTTTPQLFSALWRPTADANAPRLSFLQATATGQTWREDSLGMTETFPAWLAADPGTGGTSWSVSYIPDRWDSIPLPFLAIGGAGQADTELVLVTAYNRTAGTVTVDRAVDGSTAVAHASGRALCPVPWWPAYRGSGGVPPFGVAAAAGSYRALSGFAEAASANYRHDVGLEVATTDASGVAYVDVAVNPSVLLPDEFTQNYIDVVVYARWLLDADLISPRAVLSFRPDGSTVERFAELGTFGKSLVEGNDGAQRFVFSAAGTVTLPTERDGSRWLIRAKLTWAPGGVASTVGLDSLLMVPRTSHAASPEAKPLDSYYPALVESNAEVTKTFLHRGGATVSSPGRPPARHHGLGGDWLEPRAGSMLGLVKLSSRVPDDPTWVNDSEFEEQTASVHYSVQPRYLLVRP